MMVSDLEFGYDEMSSKSEFRQLSSEVDMESATMGKVLVAATIESLDDLFGVRKGQRTEEEVRRVEVTDALVDDERRYRSPHAEAA